MCKEEVKLNLIDNIFGYLKFELLDKIEKIPNEFIVFNNVLDRMNIMNKYTYSYTLKDIDEELFDRLINEIKINLNKIL